MKGKRGYIQLLLINILINILILILIVSYVSAQTYTTPAQCNGAGNIWCGPSSGGTCAITQQPNEPTNYGTINCVIEINQNVSTTKGYSYVLDTLTINNGVKLRFVSKATGSPCADVLNYLGGIKGERGLANDDGGAGGYGGNGGNLCAIGSSGNKGGNGNSCDATGGSGGAAGIHAGAYAKIFAKKIIFLSSSSEISAEGDSAMNGKDASGGNTCGAGGGGGGGGAGGGVLIIKTPTIEGTGIINVAGGHGGKGGMLTDEVGTLCGSHDEGTDAGGAGGGGGGGAGGVLFLSTSFLGEIKYLPGVGKQGGCTPTTWYGKDGGDNCNGQSCPPRVGGAFAPGGDGQGSTTGYTGQSEENCNDGLDNDGDLLFDMNDADCYDRTNPNSQASLFKWDTSIRKDYSTDPNGVTINTASYPWYNPSAPNGTDLSCGDDVVFSCNSEYSSCGSIPNALCPSYSAFGCSLVSGGNAYCSGPTQNSCYFFRDGFDGSCQPEAPYGCYNQLLSLTGCGQSLSDPCFDCMGEYSCAEFGEEQSCNGAECTWIPESTTDCEGTFSDVCNSLSQSNCEINPLCNYEPITNDVQSDIGYILKDGKYACFDSSSTTEPFKWWGATLPPTEPFKIYLSGNSHYISNGFNWSYCDTQPNKRFPEFAVGKYKTVPTGTAPGTMTCTSMMANLPGPGGENLKPVNCDASNVVQCRELVLNSNGQYNAFCGKDSDGLLTFSFGNFLNDCGRQSPLFGGYYCQIYAGSSWVPDLETYFGDGKLWCPILLGSEQKCQGFNPNSGSGNTGNNNYIDPTKCPGRNILGCLTQGEVVKPCEPSPPTGLGGELCDLYDLNSNTLGEYCYNGEFVRSNDPFATGKACCVGTTGPAECKTFDDSMCEDVGGTKYPDYFAPGEAECIGAQLSDTCCVGEWMGDLGGAVFAQDANAFICHDLGDKDLFVECCSENGCINYNGDTSMTGIYSSVLSGASLRTFLFFDNIDSKTNIQRRMYKSGFGPNNNIGFKKDDMKTNDWKNYNILEFDIAFIDKDNDYELSVYSGNQKSTYNINDYITSKAGSGILQHVVIDLRQNDIDWSDVSSINFSASPPTQNVIILNNFFLRSTAQYEKNFYCAGPWRTWVENLDGETDSKFLLEREAGNLTSYAEIGPYETACNAIGSFGWTGSLCCGDDTRNNNYGEYFVDVNGLCWGGAPVYHDQTVSSAKALSERVEEDYLLYYRNNLFVCDGSEQGVPLYYDIEESLNGVNTRNKKISDSIPSANILPGFSVKGSWICDPAEGWVPISSFESINLLVSLLMNLSDGDDYTLFCGTYKNVANYLGEFGDDNQDIQAMCVMRKGENSVEGELNPQTIVGFVLKKEVVNIEQDFLSKFKLFGGFHDYTQNNVLVSAGFDCSTAKAKLNPVASEFFTACTLENVTLNGGNAKIYYNKPYNLVILSDRILTGYSVKNEGIIGFISDFWYKFKAFFKALFGGSKPITPDFENNELTNMYVSVQGNRLVKGVMINNGTSNVAKVEYYNFHNSVYILGDALNASGLNLDYEAGGNKQTIYATVPNDKDLNWKIISSILRVTPQGTSTNFNVHQ